MTLWHTIGLIGNVMACYGRKSKFADAVGHEVGDELALIAGIGG